MLQDCYTAPCYILMFIDNDKSIDFIIWHLEPDWRREILTKLLYVDYLFIM